MFKRMIKVAVLVCAVSSIAYVCQAQDEFEGYRKDGRKYGGCTQYNFKVEGVNCHIVVPEKQAKGKPWVWRARFFGRFTYVDNPLLKEGFTVAYIDVAGMFGNDVAMKRFDSFYKYMTTKHGLSKKVVLEGMSRGGLPIMNWAAKNPDKISVVFSDSGVLDFKSWPGGKGKSNGSGGDWRHCQKVYKMTEEEAMAYKGNPVDNAELLAKTKVPILILTGSGDDVVPQEENGVLYAERYAEKGGKKLKLIIKTDCGHHPHSLPDPTLAVDFIKAHTKGMKGKKDYSKVVLSVEEWKKKPQEGTNN
jgi:pimeloyl-ACP methyl ester carboxylesterase